MASGSEHVSPGLSDYLAGHSTPPDALLRDLIAETAERFPDRVRMQIGQQQGTFLTMLAGLTGARHAVEVGTFTGYSSICLTRGMATDGNLICCDISEEWTSVARTYWQKAGLADRIDLRLGPALDTLRALPAGAWLDLAFIDADRAGLIGYWDELLPVPGVPGLVGVDERQIQRGPGGQRAQGVQRRAEAQLDPVGQPRLLPVGAGQRRPLLADVAADELAVGGHPAGQADR